MELYENLGYPKSMAIPTSRQNINLNDKYIDREQVKQGLEIGIIWTHNQSKKEK